MTDPDTIPAGMPPLICPPCTGDCLQGRSCPTRARFADPYEGEKPGLSRRLWVSMLVYAGVIALLVVGCALIARHV